MGQKVNPHGLRVGIIKDWSSRWFAPDTEFADNLVEDYRIREFLKKELSFSEKPVVTYSEGYLVITGANGSVSYPLSDMQKFTFGEVDENVTRIVAPESAAPQPTFIYSIDGKLMRTYQPGENRATSASVEGLPAGTYVVKNGKTSYKVLKK